MRFRSPFATAWDLEGEPRIILKRFFTRFRTVAVRGACGQVLSFCGPVKSPIGKLGLSWKAMEGSSEHLGGHVVRFDDACAPRSLLAGPCSRVLQRSGSRTAGCGALGLSAGHVHHLREELRYTHGKLCQSVPPRLTKACEHDPCYCSRAGSRLISYACCD